MTSQPMALYPIAREDAENKRSEIQSSTWPLAWTAARLIENETLKKRILRRRINIEK
ncbi:hypothetical protein D1BOALGB6SA_8305 [Olavius sp. associated proteobacterium Delta 1]|nr:hypothetical protein D1BOALGB6SA_8305 [Olavius sp. associated proteobacterium Delta 1]